MKPCNARMPTMRAGHQAKSSVQVDADDVKINNSDADTHLPRNDKVMNPFATMRRDSWPTNEMGAVFKMSERKSGAVS